MGSTLVVGPERQIGVDPESLAIVNQVLDYGSVDAAHFLPGTLEALCKDEKSLNRLSQLKFLGWGGGKLFIT